MNNFKFWIENVADMPVVKNGKWFDQETGIFYDPSHDYVGKKPRVIKSLSSKAIDARAVAKAFGGKALTGTAKQKEWGEKIRAEKIRGMDVDQAEMACDPEGLLTKAEFWIENRSRTSNEIGEFVMQQKALLKQARSLHAEKRVAEYQAIAAQYNALTAKWGF